MSKPRVLAALDELLQERPWCPTVREVADRAGLSIGGTHKNLRQLRADGTVDWADGRTRTLHLVNAKAAAP